MNPFTLITQALSAIAGIFGFINKKTELNNTPEMRDRRIKQSENEQNDEDARDIKKGDLDSLRRKLS